VVFHAVVTANETAKNNANMARTVQTAAKDVSRTACDLESIVGRLGGIQKTLDRVDQRATHTGLVAEGTPV